MNIKSFFRSQPIFWFKTKDSGNGELGEMLDKWSNLRGVTCDGKIAGLKLDATGDVLHAELKTIEGTIYLVVYNCSNVEVARFTEV